MCQSANLGHPSSVPILPIWWCQSGTPIVCANLANLGHPSSVGPIRAGAKPGHPSICGGQAGTPIDLRGPSRDTHRSAGAKPGHPSIWDTDRLPGGQAGTPIDLGHRSSAGQAGPIRDTHQSGTPIVCRINPRINQGHPSLGCQSSASCTKPWDRHPVGIKSRAQSSGPIRDTHQSGTPIVWGHPGHRSSAASIRASIRDASIRDASIRDASIRDTHGKWSTAEPCGRASNLLRDLGHPRMRGIWDAIWDTHAGNLCACPIWDIDNLGHPSWALCVCARPTCAGRKIPD